MDESPHPEAPRPFALDRTSPALLAGTGLIAVVALLGTAQFLPGSLRAIDAWPLYAQTRLDSFDDLVRVLFEPVRAGPTDGALPYWRPCSLLTYSAEQLLGGPHAIVAHLINASLHVAVALTTAWVAFRLLGRATLATVAGLLVAVAPIAIEAVPAAPRRHDLLAVLFGLLATGAALGTPSRRRLVVVATLFGLAIASKEIGALALLPIAWVTLTGPWSRRHALATITSCAVVGAVYATVRSLVIRGVESAREEPADLAASLETTVAGIVLPGPVELWAVALSAVLVAALVQRGAVAADHPPGEWVSMAIAATMLAAFVIVTGVAGQGVAPIWRTLYELAPWWSIGLVGAVAVSAGHARPAARACGAAGAILLTVNLTGTLTASPVIRRYEDWAIASTVTQRHLDAIDAAVDQGATILVVEQTAIGTRRTPDPSVRSASILSLISIQGYTAIRHPDLDVVEPEGGRARWCRVETEEGVLALVTVAGDTAWLRTLGGDGNCRPNR